MNKNIFIAIGIALIIAFAIVVNVKFFSGEDDWICKDGQRIKHGNPSSPKPTEECK